MTTKFSFKKRLKSFRYAFNGLKILIIEEHNSRIHIIIAILVIGISIVLKIDNWEWVAIIISIGLVISAELINSAIENICDFVSPEKQYQIKKIKDLSAAAVLVCVTMSAIIGLIIFISKITHLIAN